MRFFSTLTAALALALCVFSGARGQVPDSTMARQVVEHIDSLLRGRSNEGTFRMTVVRPEWSRSMTMKSWERGKDLSFVEILDPPKEAGTAFLKREGQMWSWLPDIERTIKIPPSMMMESWMGSDFTNDDLLHESSIVDDYSHRFLGQDTVESQACYVVELHPRPELAVVWDRIVISARTQDYMPVREEYYDEKGRLVRTMLFENIRSLGGRVLPTRWTLIPRLKPGQRTEFEMLDVKFDIRIPDRIFTRQNLERTR